MKATLLGLFFAMATGPVWARATQCNEVKADLDSIERELARTNINNCNSLTPEQLGLTDLSPEQQKVFSDYKCAKVPKLEEDLSQIESRLLVSDGLKELRNQTVRSQNTLENLNLSPSERSNTTSRFVQDIQLGALIQDFNKLDSEVIQELIQDTDPDMSARLNSLCVRPGFDVKDFCKSKSEFLDSNSVIGTEFSHYIASLNLSNTDQASINSYNQVLKIDNNGQTIDFAQAWQLMNKDGVHFSEFLRQDLDQTVAKPTAAQMNVIRSLHLAVPAPSTNPYLKELAQRLASNSTKLETSGNVEILRNTMADNSERHFARARARWSQAWSNVKPGQEPLCMDESGPAAFKTCVSNSKGPLLEGTKLESVLKPIFDSIEAGAQLSADTINSVDSCLESTRLTAIINSSAPPAAPCSQIGLGDVTKDEANRIVLLKLKNKLMPEINTLLQYKEYALNEAHERCATSENVEITSYTPECLGLITNISILPITALAFDSLQILDDGLRSPTGLEVPRDCSSVQPNVLQKICSRIQLPEPVARNQVQDDPRPAAVRTNPVRANPRNREMEAVIIRDAVGSAFQNVTNSFFNNRLATQNFANQFNQPLWGSPHNTGGYTAPVYGLSNYIMSYGRNELGYGLYYNNFTCPNCNYTPPTNLFNATYGLGSSSSTFPSTFFGGASSVNLASSFSFGQ